jgi:hypothetical protein
MQPAMQESAAFMSVSQEDLAKPKSSFEDAREQSAEYLGFLVSERIITSKGEVFEIPNQSLLDDEQQQRYDELELELESWDRHPDVLDDDGKIKVRGELKVPYRKDGKLVEHYNIQLAKVIFGDRYEAFKAAGGRAADVWVTWIKMNKVVAERRAADSKSREGDSAVAALPEADKG